MACGFILIALIIGLAIGAVLLRAACHLAKEDVPDFGRAMMIVFAVGIVQAAIEVVANLLTGVPIVREPGTPVPEYAPLVSIFVSVINIPIAMAIYNQLIPTRSFAKAALVWLIQVLIVLAIVALIFGMVLLFMAIGLF